MAEREITPGVVKQMYTEYVNAMEERRYTESFGDKVSGWFRSSRNDPLQDDFAKNIEDTMNALAEMRPDAAVLYEILYFMYTVPQDHGKDAAIYFMLLAVQRYTAAVIPLLSKEDAEALLEVYEEAVPKRDRVPVVKDTIKLLKKQAK